MSKFKVGQKVKCVKSYGGYIDEGMRGVIVNITNGTPPIGIKWDKFNDGHSCGETLEGDDVHSGYFVHEENIELVEEPKEEVKFKVGDRVQFTQVLNCADVQVGDIGTIEAVTTNYEIKMDNDGGTWYAQDNELKLVKEEKVEDVEVKKEFKVGDKLELIVDEPLVVEKEIIKEVPVSKFEIQEGALGTYIKFGDVTICVPTGTPMGIAKKHVDDEYNDEVGRALAMYRMITDARLKGLMEV